MEAVKIPTAMPVCSESVVGFCQSYQEFAGNVLETFPEENVGTQNNDCEVSNGTSRILKRLKIEDETKTCSNLSKSFEPCSKLMKTNSFYLNRKEYRQRKPRSVSFTFSNLEESDEESAREILAKRRRSSLNSDDGLSDLMYAAREGNVLATQKLLEEGHDPAVLDHRGFDALMYAVRDGNETIARILVKSNRINLNTRTKHGLTHILYAAINGHTECIRILLQNLDETERKAIVEVPDDSGFTPLMGAAQNGHIDSVSELLRAGASLESKDKHGMTALFWAVTSNMLKVVELLISYGANVNTRERKDKSPLLYAVVKGQTEMAKLLLRNGAKVCERVRMYCLMDYMKQARVKQKLEEDKLLPCKKTPI